MKRITRTARTEWIFRMRGEKASRLFKIRHATVIEESAGQYALVSRNMGDGGAWRITYFDAHGFRSHACFATRRACLVELARPGARAAPLDTLDRLASTTEWAQGLYRATYMRHFNDPRIAWERKETAHRFVATLDAWTDETVQQAIDILRGNAERIAA